MVFVVAISRRGRIDLSKGVHIRAGVEYSPSMLHVITHETPGGDGEYAASHFSIPGRVLVEVRLNAFTSENLHGFYLQSGKLRPSVINSGVEAHQVR